MLLLLKTTSAASCHGGVSAIFTFAVCVSVSKSFGIDGGAAIGGDIGIFGTSGGDDAVFVSGAWATGLVARFDVGVVSNDDVEESVLSSLLLLLLKTKAAASCHVGISAVFAFAVCVGVSDSCDVDGVDAVGGDICIFSTSGGDDVGVVSGAWATRSSRSQENGVCSPTSILFPKNSCCCGKVHPKMCTLHSSQNCSSTV